MAVNCPKHDLMQLLDLGMHYLPSLQPLTQETAMLKTFKLLSPRLSLGVDWQQRYRLLDLTCYGLQECVQLLRCN